MDDWSDAEGDESGNNREEDPWRSAEEINKTLQRKRKRANM